MPTVCTPAALSTAATCFKGYGRPLLKAMQIVLLCAKLNDETMDCDANTLSEAANCYLETMTETDMDAVIVYLLCQLVNA